MARSTVRRDTLRKQIEAGKLEARVRGYDGRCRTDSGWMKVEVVDWIDGHGYGANTNRPIGTMRIPAYIFTTQGVRAHRSSDKPGQIEMCHCGDYYSFRPVA